MDNSYYQELLTTIPSGKREDNFFKAGPEGRWKEGAAAWFLVQLTQVAKFTDRKKKEFFTIETDVLDSTSGWLLPTAKQWIPTAEDYSKPQVKAFYVQLFGEEAFEKLNSEALSDTDKVDHAKALMEGMRKVVEENAAAGKTMGVFVSDVLTDEKKTEFSRVVWTSADEAKAEIKKFRESPVVQKAQAAKGTANEIPF